MWTLVQCAISFRVEQENENENALWQLICPVDHLVWIGSRIALAQWLHYEIIELLYRIWLNPCTSIQQPCNNSSDHDEQAHTQSFNYSTMDALEFTFSTETFIWALTMDYCALVFHIHHVWIEYSQTAQFHCMLTYLLQQNRDVTIVTVGNMHADI